MGSTVTTIETKLAMNDAMQLLLQLGIGAGTYIALAWGCHIQIMDDIIEIFFKRKEEVK
jgi:hypothetical protein